MAGQLLYGQLFQTCPLPSTDLTGRTYIITGANSGLGLDAAKHMYRLNCGHLILACRDTSKGEAAKTDITSTVKRMNAKSPAPTVSVWQLDMASYKSVTSFARRVSTDLPRLDGAVLNAGVSLAEHTISEGLETVLTVNVAATFLLAILLIPILKATQSSDSPSLPTITIVGSAVQHFAKTAEITAALESSTDPRILKEISKPSSNYSTMDRYFLSKLLVMILTVQLCKHMTTKPSLSSSGGKGRGVLVNCVGPGYCRTSLFRHRETIGSRVSLWLIGRSSEEGSRTLVHGVVEARPETHGCYLSECRIKRMSQFIDSAQGKKVGESLWNEMVGIADGVEKGCVERI